MGTRYEHLTLAERIELYRLHEQGESMRAIARALGRSPGTVSRELERNSRATKAWPGGYEPARAEDLAQRRRRWGNRVRLTKQPKLQAHVREQLRRGFSPEQISGRLRLQHGHGVVSHESIYRFIYHRSAQKDYWHRLLPRHKSRRGHPGKRGVSPVDHIKDRISIGERVPQIAARAEPGHGEGDLMLFAQYGQAILVTPERCSRLLLATRQPNKAANPVINRLLRQFQALPSSLRQTLTFDNGTEFSYHYRLNRELGMATYISRSTCAPAEGRHRECDRTHAPAPAAKTRSRHSGRRCARSPHCRL